MSKTTRPDPAAAAGFLAAGQKHQPQHAVAQAAAMKALTTKLGRPKAWEDSARLNLCLPRELVRRIKLKAFDEGKTPGQVVVEFLRPLLESEQPPRG